MTRLQAIRADVHSEKRVSVQLPDIVPSELALTEVLVKLRITGDDVRRKMRHVARRDLLPGIPSAPGVCESRPGHSELASPFVHYRGERGFGTGDALRQRDRGIVARGDQKAAEQIFDA